MGAAVDVALAAGAVESAGAGALDVGAGAALDDAIGAADPEAAAEADGAPAPTFGAGFGGAANAATDNASGNAKKRIIVP